MNAFLLCLGVSLLVIGIGGVIHALSSFGDGCRSRVDRLRRRFPDDGSLRYLAYLEVAGQVFCALCLIVIGVFLLTGWRIGGVNAGSFASMFAFAFAMATISVPFIERLKQSRVSFFTKVVLILAFCNVLGLLVGGLLRLYWLYID